MTPSSRNLTSLSSLSKPMSLILSCALFSAIAWPAPWRHDQVRGEHAAQVGIGGDQVGHDVEAGRRLPVGRPCRRSSLRPGYLAASCSLKPFARWSSEPTPGSDVMSATSPSALPYFAVIAAASASAADASALHVVGGQERGEGLGVGAGIDADDLDRLGRFGDRLAERRELGRRDDDGGGLAGDRVLEDRDLAR